MNSVKKAGQVLGLATIGALAVAPVAFAQSQTTKKPSAGDADGVSEVVVTAQRRSENIQTVPIAIQAFSGKAIQDLGIKSSSDLAQFTPNVQIALPSGAGNQPIISIRGIGLNDYDTNNAGPNGVYLDEVYLSSPGSQTFATFDLDRVEVLKGPQGTLYGRNTSGGAINLVTAKPTDQLQANFHAEYSSYNTTNLEGAVSGPIASNLAGRFAFTLNESDGYMRNTALNTDENGQNSYAVRGQLLYKPTDRLKLLFNLHGGQVDNRPTEYRHLGDLDPTTGAQCSVSATYGGKCVDLFGYGTPSKFYDGSFNRREHLRVDNIGASMRADYAAGPIDLTSITSIEYNNKIHPEDTDASPNRLLEITYGVRSTTITQELRANQQRERYNWVAGVYYLHEALDQDQPLGALLDIDGVFGAPGAGDGLAFKAFDRSHQVTDAYAAFGQGEYKVTPRLKLIVGGRYTSERKTFAYDGSIQYQQGGENNFGPITTLADTHEALSDDAFSWRVGVNYDLARGVMAYASIATGFKSGDFNGSFLSTDPAEIARQLEPVRSETVTAYEVGLKSTFFDHRLLFDLAAFYNDYRNMQVFVLVAPVAGGSGLPVNVLDNAKSAHTDGIDLQVTAKPISSLTLTAQVGVLEARLDTFVADRDPSQPDYSGNKLPLAPHLTASLFADYKATVGAGVLNLQADANYKSQMYFDVSNSPYLGQGAYWIENVRIAYAFDAERWEVAAYVHNIANQQYYVDKFDLTNPFGFIQGVVGTPRVVGVELNYRF